VLLVLKLEPQCQTVGSSPPTSTLGRVSLPTFFEPREGGGSQWLVESGFELREEGWNLNWTLPLWRKASGKNYSKHPSPSIFLMAIGGYWSFRSNFDILRREAK
jgi:hypothetical protein